MSMNITVPNRSSCESDMLITGPGQIDSGGAVKAACTGRKKPTGCAHACGYHRRVFCGNTLRHTNTRAIDR